jgi:endonuclease III
MRDCEGAVTPLNKSPAAVRKHATTRLTGILRTFEAFYGKPAPPEVTDPLEQILFENVAYLANDARRTEAFRLLKKLTGLKPERILAASPAALQEIGAKGIMAGNTVDKLREIAAIALEDFGGNVSGVLGRPPGDAIKALKKFPSIGDPGAEKILLFSGALPVLALDSNGLRVLLRLGFGREEKNYSKSYRSAQEAAARDVPPDCSSLIEAHQLLRRHGQELCKTNHPCCEACPARVECLYFETVSRKS